MQDQTYLHLGRIVAVSIVQGGGGLPCLSPNTYVYSSGQEIACIPPNTLELPDSCMLELITNVIIINNVGSLFYKLYAALQLEKVQMWLSYEM